jgi:hypothetical protein
MPEPGSTSVLAAGTSRSLTNRARSSSFWKNTCPAGRNARP